MQNGSRSTNIFLLRTVRNIFLFFTLLKYQGYSPFTLTNSSCILSRSYSGSFTPPTIAHPGFRITCFITYPDRSRPSLRIISFSRVRRMKMKIFSGKKWRVPPIAHTGSFRLCRSHRIPDLKYAFYHFSPISVAALLLASGVHLRHLQPLP